MVVNSLCVCVCVCVCVRVRVLGLEQRVLLRNRRNLVPNSIVLDESLKQEIQIIDPGSENEVDQIDFFYADVPTHPWYTTH